MHAPRPRWPNFWNCEDPMKICFVSYEIHPATPGGYGVFLYNAAQLLLQQGHTVIFLLDLPRDTFEQFQQTDHPALPHAERCRAFRVEDLCAGLPVTEADFGNEFLWRSCRVHFALKKLVAADTPDIVEFFDFTGVAFYALAAKITRQQYPRTRLVVRLHTSLELIDREEATRSHTTERYLGYALEHRALQLAETVLYPSESYLAKNYRPYYEPWLGHTHLSKPPLLNHPHRPPPAREPDKVLFYGRLYSFKGVDLFVAAAVKLLYSTPKAQLLQFVLVGHDSRRAPDGSPTYQEFLRRRIPAQFLDRFQFKGHLDWNQLTPLLAEVQFAVLPSYFESFSYAAHELYAAGIPLVMSNLPAYDGYFTHKANALLFDGTVGDLARQMEQLATDALLRQKLAKPYEVIDNPLGDFYTAPVEQSWINVRPKAGPQPTILVYILNLDPRQTAVTLEALQPQLPAGTTVIVGRPAEAAAGNQPAEVAEMAWLLGQPVYLFGTGGQPLHPTDIHTADSLLILRAGDIVRQGYIDTCLEVLARQPEVSFAGCWKSVKQGGAETIDTFPFDAAAELVPVYPNCLWFNRAAMRTEPGRLLVDVFDPRLAEFGEIGYLWQLEDNIGPGVVIPKALVEVSGAEMPPAPNPNLLSYLLLRDTSPLRKRCLTRYLVCYYLKQEDNIPADLSAQVLAERLAAQLEEMSRTKGWRLLEKYWTLRDNIKGFLGKNTLYKKHPPK